MTETEIVELALRRVSDDLQGASPSTRIIKLGLEAVANEIVKIRQELKNPRPTS